MGTTALSVLLPGYARFIGAYLGSFSTSTDIGANNSVIATALPNAGFVSNSSLNETFIRILGTANVAVVRSVESYVASTGRLVVAGAVLAAETGSQTFELYRYDPAQLTETLNDARQEAYPALHREIIDRSLTASVDQSRYLRPTSIMRYGVRQVFLEPRLGAKAYANNIVGTLDCDFEGALTDWAVTNITLTAEAETNSPDNYTVFAGSQSGKAIPNTSAGSMYLAVPSPTAYDGEEINVAIWVYSKTAARITAALSVDSAAATTGTAHAGGGWERLTAGANIGDVSSTLEVGLTVSAGASFVFYADEIIVTAGPSEEPKPPSQSVRGWHEEGDYLVFDYALGQDMNLAIVGMGLISSVSAVTDTMEIDGPQLKYLYAQAAELWFQQDIDQLGSDELNAAQRRQTHYANRVISGAGMMVPGPVYKGLE